MMKNFAAALFSAALAAAIVPTAAQASAQSDALAACLHEHAGEEEKNALVRWAFVAIGRTSAAKSVARIPDAKIREVEGSAQKTLTRLVTKHCMRPAAALVLTDPKQGLQDALGELARLLAADEVRRRANPILPLTITDLLRQ